MDPHGMLITAGVVAILVGLAYISSGLSRDTELQARRTADKSRDWAVRRAASREEVRAADEGAYGTLIIMLGAAILLARAYL